tara:strand:- start:16826 stop:17365 length:540 start_codon:yes stop_codon:yes gene_type:complete
MRNKNNHNKRLRAFIKANLAKHVVVFTPEIGNPHYVNRLNPGAKTCVCAETLAAFDPDSNIYGKIRLDWVFYPVVVLKDAFGKIQKTHICNLDYAISNATWMEVTKQAEIELDEFTETFSHRFRANVGLLFCVDGTALSEAKIINCLKQDPNFYAVDDSRDLRTDNERREEMIKALESA